MAIASALKQAGISSLDAELLLASVLGIPRTILLARSKESLSKEQEHQFQELLARRKAGEPMAYLVGRQEFFGSVFSVTPSVLIPRPSTEGLVDVVQETILTMESKRKELDTGIIGKSWILKEEKPTCMVDIGTGSGCIAITLKKIFPNLRVVASDISDEALAVSVRNAWNLGVSIEMRMGFLLEAVSDITEFFFVVSNPPYIPEGTKLMHDVEDYEPHNALFAGNDGLSVITPLIKQCRENPFCMGVALEFRSDQEAKIDSSFT